MVERGLYFATSDFKTLIQQCGGQWNDTKLRPLVCLIRSTEDPQLYWAIPMGDMAHRTKEQRARIESFIALPSRDIRSCYYHIARTDKESLFFVSDAIPITDAYIDREYSVGGHPYIIKNQAIINDLLKKLQRILSFENRKPDAFRQHITSVKKELLKQLAK